MAGKLRVSRLPGVLDRYRHWDVVVDGEVVASLANGQATCVSVQPGTHTLRVGHRWLASPIRSFAVGNAKLVEFACRPRPHPMVWFPYAVASLYRRHLFIVLEPMAVQEAKIGQPVPRARQFPKPEKAHQQGAPRKRRPSSSP